MILPIGDLLLSNFISGTFFLENVPSVNNEELLENEERIKNEKNMLN